MNNNKLLNNKEKIRNMLSQGDAFGTTPKLFINSKTKYKTTFGSLLSFLLFAIVAVASWIYGKDMHFRENPNSIFTEEQTAHPEYFKIDKDTMNFAFGLQDATWTHFIDESIYKVIFEQYTMITDSDGNVDVQITNLKARKCNKNDFGIAVDYFQSLSWLEDLYCPDSYSITNMEGDFGAQVFSAIQGKVIPCNNSTETQAASTEGVICKPKEEIDAMLKDNYWALYTSDTVINPKNFDNPYEPVGRNIYGFSSGQMYKQIDFNFRNVYIDDNTGIIFDSISKRKGIQFTNTDKFIKTEALASGQFLQFLIRFEKVKQTRIFRTYLNLAQVLANVGGILKVCMLAFMVISGFVAEQFYNVNVVNSLFNFEYDLDGKIGSEEHMNQKKGKLFFSSVFNVFCGCCSKRHVKSQTRMLNYSVGKLSYHLDIKRILQKLIEIDKLKMLLLDEQQVKLFEYLPKPVINEKMCIEQEEKKRNNQEINPSRKTSKNKDQSQDMENPEDDHKQHINLLFEDTRTSEDKAKDAFEAFKKINFAIKKGKIDRKIIEIMDVKLKNEFESKLEKQVKENKINISVYQKDRSSIFQLQQHDLTQQRLLQNKNQNYDNDVKSPPMEDLSSMNNSMEKQNRFQDDDFIVQEEHQQVQKIDETLFGPPSQQDLYYNQNYNSPLLSPMPNQRQNQQQNIIQRGNCIYFPINLNNIQNQIIQSIQQTQNQMNYQQLQSNRHQKQNTLQSQRNKKNNQQSSTSLDIVQLPSPKKPKLKLSTSKFDTRRDRGSSSTSTDLQNNIFNRKKESMDTNENMRGNTLSIQSNIKKQMQNENSIYNNNSNSNNKSQSQENYDFNGNNHNDVQDNEQEKIELPSNSEKPQIANNQFNQDTNDLNNSIDKDKI